jgi:hypothetical protein
MQRGATVRVRRRRRVASLARVRKERLRLLGLSARMLCACPIFKEDLRAQRYLWQLMKQLDL